MKARDAAKLLIMRWAVPTRNYPAQSVNDVKFEKPYCIST